MKLYEVVDDYLEILSLEEDEVTQEQLEVLKVAIEEEIKSKSGNIIKVVKNIESEINTIEEEVKRLNELKKSKVKTLDNLKEYTKYNLLRLGTSKITTPFGNISVGNNPPSVNVLDENAIPEKFIKEKVVKTLDKKYIKEELKNGIEIPGCELNYTKRLIIK